MRSTGVVIAVALTVLALAGCGGDEDSGATGTTSTNTAVETSPPPPPATTVTPPPAPPTTPKPTTVAIRVVGGVPQGGIARPKVKKGTRVVVVVRADAGEAVHIHGYDLERPIRPGEPTRLPFKATIPGRFEVELHHPDALLAVVEVRP